MVITNENAMIVTTVDHRHMVDTTEIVSSTVNVTVIAIVDDLIKEGKHRLHFHN